MTFTIALALSLVLVPVARAVILLWARRWNWWAEPVVVIGTGERAARVIRSIQQARHFGYRPVAALAFGATDETAREVEGVPVVGGLIAWQPWRRRVYESRCSSHAAPIPAATGR